MKFVTIKKKKQGFLRARETREEERESDVRERDIKEETEREREPGITLRL